MDPRKPTRDEILNAFTNGAVSTVVIVGGAGVGKTWLAKQITDEAIRQGSCYGTLWLNLNKKFNENSLYENIAHQLNLLFEEEECEEYDETEKQKEEISQLKLRIERKLRGMRKREESSEYLLLVLDDEGRMTSEKELMEDLHLKDFLAGHLLKILITTRKEAESGKDGEKDEKIVVLNPLSEKDLLDVLKKTVGESMSFTGESESAIGKLSLGLPVSVVVLGKSLKFLTRSGDMNLSPTQKTAFEELAFFSGNESVTGTFNPVLQLAYDMLRTDENAAAAVNCFWNTFDVFETRGSVNYRELIVHWIFEGCFDPVNCVQKAYLSGHSVLMELLNRGLLKTQENSEILPEVERTSLIDLRRHNFLEKTGVGLARAFRDDKRKILGKNICEMDQTIRTLRTRSTKRKISTFLVEGDRFRRENPKKFLENVKHEIEILGLFNPTFDSIIPSLSKLLNLQILVIRNCDFLENIDGISDLQCLETLEISGSSRLTVIPDEFFKKVLKIQSLNLSNLPIESLPSTVSRLSELRFLILKNCPFLKLLPNLRPLTNLEVVDTHGCSSLIITLDRNSNTNFSGLQKLHTLDFSDSKLQFLPVFKDPRRFPVPSSVTRLLLRNCVKLIRLPHLTPLTSLQVLDLSGAVSLMEINETAFENKLDLKIFDLSEAAIEELPPEIAKLVDLRILGLANCVNLKTLPSIDTLVKLESLDVSGCVNLTNIEGSFADMSRLREIDVSRTKIVRLPDLPARNKIRRLCFKGCSSLDTFPEFQSLTSLQILDLSGCLQLKSLQNLDKCEKLEVLDLSDCSELETIGGSFQNLSCLQKLDISSTKIKCFPVLSNSCSLIHISIRNCTQITEFPSKESVSKLQELDIYGTNLPDIAFISGLITLKRLSLKLTVVEYLEHLKSLECLEVLTVYGLAAAESLCRISGLRSLKRVVLPDFNVTHEVDWGKLKGLSMELSFEKFGLSVPNEIPVFSTTKPPLLATGKKAVELLEKRPELCGGEFHISLSFGDDIVSGRAMSRQRQILGYEDIYFKTKNCKDQEQGFLEIHGSCNLDDVSDHVKEAFSRVKNVAFVDNGLLTDGSMILNRFGMNSARGLWLERCGGMKTMFSDVFSQVENLETLWVSNMPELDKVYDRNLPADSFKNLKHLSLDCCPKIRTLFSKSQAFLNLETLQIKFCDQLERVFVEETELPNLQTLILVGLAELYVVGARLPLLKDFLKMNCPRLGDTKESLTTGS